MRRWFIAAALVVVSSPAFALPTAVKKGLKLGTGCVGPVSTLAPKLGTCTIDGAKMRLWCPNGDIFDADEGNTSVPLLRSLCNLTQVP